MDNVPNQSGFSAIGIVLILLMLGMLLLTGFNELLFSWQKQSFYERQYFSRYNHAYSSLMLALQQKWLAPTLSWQCFKHPIEQLEACIKLSSHPNFTLLKSSVDDFSLYYLAEYDFLTEKLKIQKGHWLDFCPEKTGYDCD